MFSMICLHYLYSIVIVFWIIFGKFEKIYHAKSVCDVVDSFIRLRIEDHWILLPHFPGFMQNSSYGGEKIDGYRKIKTYDMKHKKKPSGKSSTMFSPCGHTSPQTILLIFPVSGVV